MSNFSRIICVLAVSIASLGAQAISVSSTTRTYGMVGVVAGQTARLNVLNYGVVTPTPAAVTAGCPVTLKFIDGNGKLLVSKTVVIMAGMAAYLDYSPVFATAMPQRIEMRAEIDTPAVVPANAASTVIPVVPCNLVPTLEIFENVTQKTEIVM